MKVPKVKASVFVCALMLLPLSCGLSEEARAARSDAENFAVAVLFERFETVSKIVPSLLTDTRENHGTEFVQEPFGYFVVALERKAPQLRTAALESTDAVLLGTKDYTSPKGLGRVVSTRCYIAVLRNGHDTDFSKYLGKPSSKTRSGHFLWKWSAELSEFGDGTTRKSALYATLIDEKYLVVSNSVIELQNVADRLSSSKASKDFNLIHLRQWHLIENREFWTYRRYKEARFRAPATIFNGLKGIGPKAEALIMYVDPATKRGVLRILSSDPEDSSTAINIHEIWTLPPAQAVGKGEWEIFFPLSLDDPNELTFKAWWLFGMGVAV